MGEGRAAGFDFAVTEGCGEFGECDAYLAAYEVVLDVEYVDGPAFTRLCRDGELPPGAIRRDLGPVPAGEPGHVFDRCP